MSWAGRCVGRVVGVAALSGALASGARAAATFAPARSFATNPGPASVAVADFNGDGKLDLVTVNSANVSVLLGKGNGTFGAHTDFVAGTNPNGLAVADFNADGKPDLAVSDGGVQGADPGFVSVLLDTTAAGATTPSFSGPTAFATKGNGPTGVAAGDFNGDGKPDLAVIEFLDIASLLNTTTAGGSTPTFGSPTKSNSPPGGSPAASDFDGDGRADFAFAQGGDQAIFVYRGNGAGAFANPGVASTGGVPASLAVGDFNGDGKPDLAAANIAFMMKPDSVSLNLNTTMFGNTTPTFGKAANFPAGKTPIGVAAADLNGDRKLDVAVANYDSNNASVLLGNGAGSLSAAVNFPAGTHPRSVAVGDFNRDGAPDLAIANLGSSNVSVLLNVPTADPIPASLVFGSAKLGTVSAPQPVAIANHGSAPLRISGFALTGANSVEFLASSDTCDHPIAPAKRCTVQVKFAPQGNGTRTATLTPITNARTKKRVALTGTVGTTAAAAPRVSALKLSPSVFAALGSGPTTAALAHGSRVSYRDSESAKTTFTVTRRTRGVKKGAKCRAAPRHPKHGAKRCTRFVKVGSFTHADVLGANRFRFTGRLHHHKLRPGSYRLTAVPRSSAGKKGRASTKGFRIVGA